MSFLLYVSSGLFLCSLCLFGDVSCCSPSFEHPQGIFCRSYFGVQTTAGGFRSLSSDIVYKTKDLQTTPLIRDYLLGTGKNTYIRNCNRGCTDISARSSHCKTPDMTDPYFFFGIQCYLDNAICKMGKGKCSWYNADSCKLSAMPVP